MDNERTVVLINTGDQGIGLADTMGRMYRLGKGARMRISAITLQDILDFPGSKVIFNEGLAKIGNISESDLYKMGLNEDEIKKYLLEPKEEIKVPEEKKSTEEVKVSSVKKVSSTKKSSVKKASTASAAKKSE